LICGLSLRYTLFQLYAISAQVFGKSQKISSVNMAIAVYGAVQVVNIAILFAQVIRHGRQIAIVDHAVIVRISGLFFRDMNPVRIRHAFGRLVFAVHGFKNDYIYIISTLVRSVLDPQRDRADIAGDNKIRTVERELTIAGASPGSGRRNKLKQVGIVAHLKRYLMRVVGCDVYA